MVINVTTIINECCPSRSSGQALRGG